MKKLVSVLVALMFALSLAAVAVAADKPASAPAAAPAKKAEAKKAPKAHQITGMVEAVDAAAGTLTVKGKKESVSLKAGEKVKLDGIAAGEKVLVTYSGDTASSVKKVAATKAAPKKAAKKEAPAKMVEPMKKEIAPAATTAPAEKK
ncbi:MAG: hypothetical protein WBA34_00945 [Candidatus Deferrimicrobiaceae bacterium]